MSAAKKRKIPTLAERIAALKEETDAALSHEADLQRPRGEGKAVPADVIRQMWMAKAGGNVFEAYLIASREDV